MKKAIVFCLVIVCMILLLALNAHMSSHPATLFGDPVALGKGTVRTYVELNANNRPVSIGVLFARQALAGLPSAPNSTGRCFDLNGNGTFDGDLTSGPHGECLGDYESVLSLPNALTARSDMPFRWVGVNWNPGGHPPPNVYTLPHFDIHFYIMEHEAVQRIRPGRCGELIDCEDFKRARHLVPPQYTPKHHIDVGAAVPAMGNHLIDPTSPEFGKPPQTFTHTFLYGAFDGHITFYEPMITHAFFMSQPDMCKPLHLPAAWETSGYYPTRYCIRYQARREAYTVSLEGLVYRQAQ